MKERIQKILGNAGVASRRNVEEMVLRGRIAVNGKVVRELPVLIDPNVDRVSVDDEPVRLKSRETRERFYIMMNKPKGVYSTNVAQGEQTRAIDLLPAGLPARVYPVGQLDAESKGLLLLTNDGELTNRLTHPRYGVPKVYRAVVDGFVTEELVKQLENGMWVGDAKTSKGVKSGRSHIRVMKRTREKSILEISMREGRNPQIRRMLAKLGHKVRDLTRVRMGPLTLDKLAPGQFRPLTPREVRELRGLGRREGKNEAGTRRRGEGENETAKR
ncbi:MAG TPA: pseudouridine synthase [Tepidisphaeraceae bacterium]|jgi:23S rRNA pseudouridine2605 synthase